jgi:hypothetical protein
MYYKKYLEIPPLPNDIKQGLIQIAENNIKNNIPMAKWYQRYETENNKSIAFVEFGKRFQETNGGESGGVGFYHIPYKLNHSICDFYKKLNQTEINFERYALQVVTGGNFVGPHIDDPLERADGSLYLLKSGGTNVRTRWYEIKEEYQHLPLENHTVVPYSKLNLVEDHCLEEDAWHWLNFSKLHSVENQESLRIALWGKY